MPKGSVQGCQTCGGGSTDTTKPVSPPSPEKLGMKPSSRPVEHNSKKKPLKVPSACPPKHEKGQVGNMSYLPTQTRHQTSRPESQIRCTDFVSNSEPDAETKKVIRDKKKGRSNAVVSKSPSGAVSEVFSRTVPMDRGFLVGKSSPGDCALKHLTSECGGFVVDKGRNQGQHITNSPEQDFPIAQGYLVDVEGNVLVDPDGSPIMANAPLFSSIIVSDADLGEEHLDRRLFNLRAPYSRIPISLYAKNGCWVLGELFADGFCSTRFPDTVASGGILVNRKKTPEVIDPTNPESWCIEEYDSGCGILFQSLDDEGETSLNTFSFSNLDDLTSTEECGHRGLVIWTKSCDSSCATPELVDMNLNQFIDLSLLPSNEAGCEEKSYLVKLTVSCDGTVSQVLQECPAEDTEEQISARVELFLTNLPEGHTMTEDIARQILGYSDV